VALFLLVYPLVNQTPKQTEAAQQFNNSEVKQAEVKKSEQPTTKVEHTDKPTVQPVVVPQPTPQPQPPVALYHSDEFYKEYIFQHESSGVLSRVNSIGCYGLGQSCSDALRNACPNWQNDLSCQLAFWDRYADAYGGWAKSYEFWNCIGRCYSARINAYTNKTATWW